MSKLVFNPITGKLDKVFDKASEITNTPVGDIIATDVQAAINEIDTEKASIGVFDIDINGDLEPSVSVNTDDYFETDVNNNLMPKAA